MDTLNRALLEWRSFWQDHMAQWKQWADAGGVLSSARRKSSPVWLLEEAVAGRPVSGPSPRCARLYCCAVGHDGCGAGAGAQ